MIFVILGTELQTEPERLDNVKDKIEAHVLARFIPQPIRSEQHET